MSTMSNPLAVPPVDAGERAAVESAWADRTGPLSPSPQPARVPTTLTEFKSTERLDRREKCILVGVLLPEGDFNPDDPLDEIYGLAKTAGLVVVGSLLQR